MSNNNYTPPVWSSKPVHKFKLNVVKNGENIECIDVGAKEYYKIGRGSKTSDIKLMHFSCSRSHCILQHKNDGTCYLFDLETPHKTFLNNKAIRPFEFVPFRVGDFVQFGESSRFYFLDGSKDLMPPENDDPLDNKPDKKGPNLGKNFFKKREVHRDQEDNKDSNSDEKGDDFCNWGQKEENNRRLKIDEKYLEKSKLRSKYNELKEVRAEIALVKKADRKIPSKIRELEEREKELEYDIEEGLLNDKTEQKRRREMLKSYIDDEEDEFYDRTIKQKKKSATRSDEIVSKTPKNNKAAIQREKSALEVALSNLELKHKRELEAKDELELRKNSNLTGGDSLDDFMIDVEIEANKRKLEKLEKGISSTNEKITTLQREIEQN